MPSMSKQWFHFHRRYGQAHTQREKSAGNGPIFCAMKSRAFLVSFPSPTLLIPPHFFYFNSISNATSFIINSPRSDLLLMTMGMKRRVERKPHFFKVLIGDFAHRLKMPPNFLKHIANEASKSAILEGPNGCSWSVKIKRSVDGTFLASGWSKFVQDHSLKEREFLVFRYNGNMHFNVLVFDTTACEREDLFAIQYHKKLKLAKGASKRRRSRKRTLDVSCDIEPLETCEPLKLLTYGTHEAEHLQDGVITSVEGSCVTSLSPNVDSKAKPDIQELPIYSEISHFSRRRRVTREERLRAGEAARSFSSDLPFTIMHMSNTSVYKRYLMRFPLGFSRKHLPRERTNMRLTDPKGKSWTMVYVPGEREQRDRLSVGWDAFAQGNNIEEGDSLAFEVTGPTEMRVHIFRAVVETALAIEAA